VKNYSKQLTVYIPKGLAFVITLLLMVVFLGSCQTNSPRSSVSREAIHIEQQPMPRAALGQEARAGQFVFSENDKPDWMIEVEQGNKASGNKDWYYAAQFYNTALDLINNPRATPISPSRFQIEEVIRLASHAQMLASSSGGTRSLGQNCDQMMRSSVRGIQITKHLMPVEFKTAKTTFTKKGAWAAQQLSNCLIEKQNAGLSLITLIGHTDESGSDDYNDRLSRKRAHALKSYLKGQGVNLNISTEGRGEREPLQQIPSHLSQKEKYQLNRRVEVRTN